MFMNLMAMMNRQMEVIGSSLGAEGRSGSLQDIFKESNSYLKSMSNHFGKFSDSIEALTDKLKDLETEKTILHDPAVQKKTHQAQREMIRANQKERDKAAPGMLLRNIFASEKSPVWMRYIANKIGIRSAEMRGAELKERENINVDIAQTKIDKARAIKRRRLLGVAGKGETLPEQTGVSGLKDWEIAQTMEEFVAGVTRMNKALSRVTPVETVANPLLTVAPGEEVAGAMKGEMEMEEFIPPTTLPVGTEQPVKGRQGKKAGGEAPETGVKKTEQEKEYKEAERRNKQVRSKSSNTTEEGVTIIAFSRKTETILGKIIGKAIRDNTKLPVLDALKEFFSEGGGGEGGEGDTAPQGPAAQVGEGSLSSFGKKLGKSIGSLVRMIPFVGRKASGGPVSPGAGTGVRTMAVNLGKPGELGEGLTDKYDSSIMSVPSSSSFDVVKKSDVAKAIPVSGGGGGTNTSGIESILKQLLKTNEEANKYLSQMAEKESSSVPSAPPTRISTASQPRQRGIVHEMAPIGIL
jgi:hypothetical protein